jgi:hypothetical protein
MGWAYDNAFFGYFHIDPFDLGVGVIEYMLVSLSLFSPAIVIAASAVILVSAVRTWDRRRMMQLIGRPPKPKTCQVQSVPIGGQPFTPPRGTAIRRLLAVASVRRLVPTDSAEQLQVGRLLLIGVGAIVTITGFALALLASYFQINTYVVLGLLGGGPLLLTWPTRQSHHGRFPYALAIVVAAVCALWATSLYASNLGRERAEQVVRDLATRTAVVLYTIQPLALSGPGVAVQRLPPGFLYHYRYEGLRLLTVRSGTYYLLPVHWSTKLDLTYIIAENDQVRIELYLAVLRS